MARPVEVITFDVKQTQGFESLLELCADIGELRGMVPSWQQTETEKIMDRIEKNIINLIVVKQ